MENCYPKESEVGQQNGKPTAVSKETDSSGSSKMNTPRRHSLGSPCSTQCSASSDIDASLFVSAVKSPEQEPVTVNHQQGPTTEGNQPSAPQNAYPEEEDPMLPVPMQLDSNWLRTLHRQSVNALRGSSPLDKDFMNLWNDFSLCREHMPSHVVKDAYKSLREFVIENRQTIIDRSLGVSLLAHANVLRELGQITNAQWREVMFTMFTKGKFD